MSWLCFLWFGNFNYIFALTVLIVREIFFTQQINDPIKDFCSRQKKKQYKRGKKIQQYLVMFLILQWNSFDSWALTIIPWLCENPSFPILFLTKKKKTLVLPTSYFCKNNWNYILKWFKFCTSFKITPSIFYNSIALKLWPFWRENQGWFQ